ncbi:hypothetical protein A5662_24625 [Mycobacteriaceae bacterium 1482268.1]|nr:hypothetical protein A5662_24625 [Mycobacteriaceae bacterium 1482268.1]
MFNGWNQALSPRVGVVPVDIAHRERFETLRELVRNVHDHLVSRLDGPYAFFGHSFGALVAYRLACLRAEARLPLPTTLVLSSYAPPHLPPPIPAVDHLDAHRLAGLLVDLGGIPPELAEWPALRDAASAAARTDLQLCETDVDDANCVLPCPIHVLGGSEDPLISECDLEQWRGRTSGHFSMHLLPGGHFYLSDEEQLFTVLRPLMSATIGAKC